MEIFKKKENKNSTESNSAHKHINSNKRSNTNLGVLKTSTPNSKSKSSENSSVSKSIGGGHGQNSSKGLNIEWSNEIYRQALQNGDSSKRDPNIHVKLETKQLWQQFASIGTEMIITKCGR